MTPRGEDWADRRDVRAADDAYEPVYPDGSVRHECWNSSVIAGIKKSAAAPKQKLRSSSDEEEESED